MVKIYFKINLTNFLGYAPAKGSARRLSNGNTVMLCPSCALNGSDETANDIVYEADA